jgi:outer membrane protein assembly factor BamB
MTSRLLLVWTGILSLSAAANAADWPQWRGPNRNGISKETGLLQEWPKEGPRLLWQVKDVGEGYSTPAVSGDRLFMVSNKGKDLEFVLACRVKDGHHAWSTPIGKVGPNQGPQYPGSRSTPTVDGAYLYVLGSDGDLACLKTADGATVWHKNLRKEFGGQPGMWAYAESPLVDGAAVVCTPGGKEATLVALNKKDGSVIWKSAVPGGDKAAYASIIILEFGGRRQYVQFLADGVVGVDARDGRFLWRYAKTASGSPANIPTPVAANGFVYTGTGMSGGGLVKLKTDNGGIAADPVYFQKNLPTSIGGAILLDNFLYGTNAKGLLCAEFTTGKEKWQEMGVGAGAICYADGRLYVHSENGEVALVAATPEAYQEKGRFTPPNQPDRGKSKAWTYPVVANGRLYLRDLDVLWCYDIRDSKRAK